MTGRATVMNLFRVPLNFIVIIILTQVYDRFQYQYARHLSSFFSGLLIDFPVIFLPV